ncbi:MAG: sarcosine oxidase subunit beta [Candidatus Aldehydirespiratoraceae bacterium]|jgi:sarcosine oxidase subunit beta
MNEFTETKVQLNFATQKKSYDVIVIGGGGHGLSTAYHLAARHDITNVAVIERGYIGGGNTGRNTTVIRANYGIPEAVRFYQRSMEMYEELEAETDRWMMHNPKGLLWLCHTEAGVRREQARASINQAFGTETVWIDPAEVKRLAPQVDLDPGGRGEMPVLGGSYHVRGATARHDRVVWALAEGAMRRGVDIIQHTEVRGLLRSGSRITGVRTDTGDIAAGTVVCAVGGDVTSIADMADVRLPIRTHPLQAFVTNTYEQGFHPIVASGDMGFYLSQTARGEILAGQHIDPQPSFNRRSGVGFLSELSHRAMLLLPFLANLRIQRQWTGSCDMSPDYSPIMGATGVDGFVVTTGWGTWGFKAIPVGGHTLAEFIATGVAPELMAPFSLDRFERDRTLADRGSAGTH